MTAQDASVEPATGHAAPPTPGSTGDSLTTTAKGKVKNKSSLHRAVMERLEVQRAMSDLAGTKKPE